MQRHEWMNEWMNEWMTQCCPIETSHDVCEISVRVSYVWNQTSKVAVLVWPQSVNSLRPSDAFCVVNLTIIASDNGLSPGRRQAIIGTNDQWKDIVNWALRNKIQWNLNQSSYIFIQDNAFENVVCSMAAILSLPQYVNQSLNALTSMYALGWNRMLNTMSPRQNGWLFADDIFKTFSPMKCMNFDQNLIEACCYG